jgi:hypothetical protein
LVFLKPNLRNDSLERSGKLAAEVFNQYKDLSIIKFLPRKDLPNSGPAVL